MVGRIAASDATQTLLGSGCTALAAESWTPPPRPQKALTHPLCVPCLVVSAIAPLCVLVDESMTYGNQCTRSTADSRGTDAPTAHGAARGQAAPQRKLPRQL